MLGFSIRRKSHSPSWLKSPTSHFTAIELAQNGVARNAIELQPILAIRRIKRQLRC